MSTLDRTATVQLNAPIQIDEDGVTSSMTFSKLEAARLWAYASTANHKHVTIWRAWPEAPSGREILASYFG